MLRLDRVSKRYGRKLVLDRIEHASPGDPFGAGVMAVAGYGSGP